MAAEPPEFDEAELTAIIHRLRTEVRVTRGVGGDEGEPPGELRARRELDRLWAVSADRPYLHRAGWWGRLRGALLVPPKAVLRRLMRWYVQPLATDQRAFNAGVLRLADEVAAHLARIEERMRRLEGGKDTASERSSPPPS
jgi:hypothetical protein